MLRFLLLLFSLFFASLANDVTSVQNSPGSVNTNSVLAKFAEELEGYLKRGAVWRRIEELITELRPIFDVLPQDADGRLETTATRYALHRYFQRRSWLVPGLAQGSGDHLQWDGRPPPFLLRDRVFEYVSAIFKKELAHTGLGAGELAVQASVFQRLAEDESAQRLQAVLKSSSVAAAEGLSLEQARKVLDSYALDFLDAWKTAAPSFTDTTAAASAVAALQASSARAVALPLVQNLTSDKRLVGAKLTFAEVQEFAVAFTSVLGPARASGECSALRQQLLSREDAALTGTLSLEDFRTALIAAAAGDAQVASLLTNVDTNAWKQYLRALGALDEEKHQVESGQTGEREPRVLVANFMQSAATCVGGLGGTSYVSVCCPNVCNDLLRKMEKVIQAPEASVDYVEDVVGEQLNVQLSTEQLAALGEIAQAHEGYVQLHGRQFAQWMHRVFPQQCAWPHPPSKTHSQSRQDWIEGDGDRNFAVVVDEDRTYEDFRTSDLYNEDYGSLEDSEKEFVQTVKLFFPEQKALEDARERSLEPPRLLLGIISALAAAGAVVAHVGNLALAARKAVKDGKATNEKEHLAKV
eukprot:TRINITY_DN14226_c1_g2_i1.p2 TRINITY_DN14226_c1_g2~~TRINITY_DN14226_c1_g2_i1.p2  ORF type:complete len:583 (+),score=154.13 TRINITY_DN14226_c1_g2_i1:40-1788(+)